LVIIDSVAALVPKAEIEGDMGDSQCRFASKTYESGSKKTYLYRVQIQYCCSLYHQTRMKIGTAAFMNPETTSEV
jgi:recombination protein RecA